jgi:phage-related protein
MKPTVTFTRSDGLVFVIDDKMLGVTELDGLGKPSIEIFTEKRAVGSGDLVTSKRLSSRSITVKATSRIHDRNSVLREIASSFFSHMYTYDVEFQYDGIVRKATECEIQGIDIPTDNIYKPFKMTVTVMATTGYLQGGGMNGQNLNEVRGGFGFPFVSLVDRGFNYGLFLFNKKAPIFNDGAGPTYVKAVMTCRGEVVNPKLTHGNSYIRIVKTMHEGDELVIDTEKRIVTLNGENVITLVDKRSNFQGMTIEVGNSEIGFDADSGDSLLDVSVYWAKRYETM